MKLRGELSGAEYHYELYARLLQLADGLLEPGDYVLFGEGHGASVGEPGYQHVVALLGDELLDLFSGESVQPALLDQVDAAAEIVHDVAGHVDPGSLANGYGAYLHLFHYQIRAEQKPRPSSLSVIRSPWSGASPCCRISSAAFRTPRDHRTRLPCVRSTWQPRA